MPTQRTGNHLEVRDGWWSWAEAFGQRVDTQSPAQPDWFLNVLNQRSGISDKPWFEIPDFSPEVGDIKGVWEASRMDWLFPAAQRAAQGNKEGLKRINALLTNWLEHNPPYRGTNWKCGQEASIRIMDLAMTALILKQHTAPEKALIDLIRAHARRIEPTLMYAVSQNNNHGTSEAAALYIAGSWLKQFDVKEAAGWKKKGRKWLENRVKVLVTDDGTFSQRSVYYHRLFLDTLSMVELWQRNLSLNPFSTQFYEKARKATAWLGNFVANDQGFAPVLGSNDGARLLPLTDSDYRDLRPSVQLASILFCNAKAYTNEGLFNDHAQWLGLTLPEQDIEHRITEHYADGGYVVIRNRSVVAFLVYPKYRFRASGGDMLHVDLWVNGENILCDAGSYSYNCDDEMLQDYFKSARAHNTAQFDEREQLVKLKRFLSAGWPTIKNINQNLASGEFSVEVKDWFGATHRREVALNDSNLTVNDYITGFKRTAALRWRFANKESARKFRSSISTEAARGYFSPYYGQKEEVMVLEGNISHSPENDFHQSYQITTEINF